MTTLPMPPGPFVGTWTDMTPEQKFATLALVGLIQADQCKNDDKELRDTVARLRRVWSMTFGGEGTQLPKKNARDLQAQLETEMRECRTVAELDDWHLHAGDRIDFMPLDWQSILTMRIKEHRADLFAGATKVTWEDPPPSPPVSYCSIKGVGGPECKVFCDMPIDCGGNGLPARPRNAKSPSPPQADMQPAASPAAPFPADTIGAAGDIDPLETERLERRREAITKEAMKGRAALNAEWKRTTKADGDAFGGVKGEQMAEWIRIAKEADERTPLVMAG